MKFVNGWNSFNRQVDKFEVNVRFGWITVFEVYIDVSRREWRVTVFNLSIVK